MTLLTKVRSAGYVTIFAETVHLVPFQLDSPSWPVGVERVPTWNRSRKARQNWLERRRLCREA